MSRTVVFFTFWVSVFVNTLAGSTAKGALASKVTYFTDEFSNYATSTCFEDGTKFGPWTAVFDGYGCISTTTLGEDHALVLQPKTSTLPTESHAALVVGPRFTAPYNYDIRFFNQSQLRTGSAPNPWEVAWVVWDYTDNDHFYYFIAKPTGWELGKRDPAYPGGQRNLASGTNLIYPIGQWNYVRVEQVKNKLTVYANGSKVVSFTDKLNPYLSGQIGIYSEDALVYVTSAKVTSNR